MEPAQKRQRLVVRIKHFCMSPYDDQLDYKSICESIYDGDEYLCVKEYDDLNREHVHFQGATSFSDETLKTKTQELITKVHRVTREYEARAGNAKKPRPVRWKGGICDTDGYAYMSKDTRRMILATTFTEEKLLELAGKSVENVNKLKTEYNEAIWKTLEAHPPTPDQLSDLKKMMKIVRNYTLLWYERQQKPIPFNLLDNKIKNCLFYWKRNGSRVMKVDMF